MGEEPSEVMKSDIPKMRTTLEILVSKKEPSLDLAKKESLQESIQIRILEELDLFIQEFEDLSKNIYEEVPLPPPSQPQSPAPTCTRTR